MKNEIKHIQIISNRQLHIKYIITMNINKKQHIIVHSFKQNHIQDSLEHIHQILCKYTHLYKTSKTY